MSEKLPGKSAGKDFSGISLFFLLFFSDFSKKTLTKSYLWYNLHRVHINVKQISRKNGRKNAKNNVER